MIDRGEERRGQERTGEDRRGQERRGEALCTQRVSLIFLHVFRVVAFVCFIFTLEVGVRLPTTLLYSNYLPPP
jgi:hypothetical protein